MPECNPSANVEVTAYDLQRIGGRWIAAARSWVKCNIPDGERVVWGSGNQITMTVAQFEEAAACIAVAAMNEVRK